jgi:Bacterial pre-peptidase C-terminal domain
MAALAVVSCVCLPAVAQAQLAELRCAADNPDTVQVKLRAEWARRCALLGNTAGPNSWFLSSKALDTSSQWAKEYREINTNKAYSSSLNQFDINYSYLVALYESPPVVTVSQETSGPTTGFYKWAHPRPRARPLYSVFESVPAVGQGIQLFPHPGYADCRLYTDQNGTNPWAGNFYAVASCMTSPVTLTNGVPLASQNGALGGLRYYLVNVPAGTTQLVVEISGGTGDADLYVQQGSFPSMSSYACRPFLNGNFEQCVFNNPPSGTWYVMLHAWSNYSGVTITSRRTP